jgi:hypothetical protein
MQNSKYGPLAQKREHQANWNVNLVGIEPWLAFLLTRYSRILIYELVNSMAMNA